jgi:hypothetical protein
MHNCKKLSNILENIEIPMPNFSTMEMSACRAAASRRRMERSPQDGKARQRASSSGTGQNEICAPSYRPHISRPRDAWRNLGSETYVVSNATAAFEWTAHDWPKKTAAGRIRQR